MKQALLIAAMVLALSSISLAQSITSIEPDVGQRGQVLGVTISGEITRFAQASETIVSLEQTGTATQIFASSINILSDLFLEAVFSIPSDAPLGDYDVKVIASFFMGTDETYILEDGFLIVLLCGDAEGSGSICIDDVVFLITYLYFGGPSPIPYAAGDVNCDGTVNLLDISKIVAYIFRGGHPPCDLDWDGQLDCWP